MAGRAGGRSGQLRRRGGDVLLAASSCGRPTRAARPDNLTRVAQFIPLLGEVEQKIVGCFHNGGGLPYSDYPRSHKLRAEMSGEVFDAARSKASCRSSADYPSG